MKSVKRGRAPSMMDAGGSAVTVVFGILWTILSYRMTKGFGVVHVVFVAAGVLFTIAGAVQGIYHYKNATSEDRFSELDITDSTEEGDPADSLLGIVKDSNAVGENKTEGFCPYCGTAVEADFSFCKKCGKKL